VTAEAERTERGQRIDPDALERSPAVEVLDPDALDTTTLSTQPEPVRPPSLGMLGWARWSWRQLTSMRTALVLLFLLAVAAVPGSVFPQRGAGDAAVQTYLAEHPSLGPLLDRLGMFDVFGSVWFAAVYLLLFTSLAGCVVPRSLRHAKALRARPPAAPRNLSRLPEHRTYVSGAAPQVVLDAARDELRRRRWRVASGAGTVSAEKGYLRETGNLLFHLALIAMLAGVAVGSLFGTSGSVIVVEGTGFANTLTSFDSFGGGRLADTDNLPPFSFQLTRFSASYQRGGPQNGAPRSFAADVVVRDSPGSAPRSLTIKVNDPLVVDGTKVFLIGHGYAPHVTVRDGQGKVVLSGAVPFLPRNGDFLSEGVIKAPDARPTELGFRSVFLPTARMDPVLGGVSTFPAADDPELLLTLFKGDLGLDTGQAQSVYALDTSRMTQVAGAAMRPGETWLLPDRLGSISFDGVQQFAAFSVAYDPGKDPVFVAAMVALGGLMLSLFVRRRRVWVRATPQDDGRTLVAVGGLARVEAGGLTGEVDDLLGRLKEAAPDIELGPGDPRDDPTNGGQAHQEETT
jgi:cytochrome c biogenesis protein